MVRVLLFHYFKAQLAFSNSLQPTTLTATKDYLFLATGGMKVLVYSLEQPNFPLFCQFPTISKPVKLICNEKARCVVTVERKSQRSRSGEEKVQTFSRAYFNWFEANPGEAVRTYVAGHSLFRSQETDRGEDTASFLALEIPAQSASVISCCPTSGNIAVGSETKVSLYRWKSDPSSDSGGGSTVCCDMEHFVDIEPSLPVRDLVLSDSYIAFRSNLDVQVLKLVFLSERETASGTGNTAIGTASSQKTLQESSNARFPWSNESTAQQKEPNCHSAMDDSCISWSFDDCSTSSYSSTSQLAKSNEDVSFPTVRKEPVFKDFLPDPKEVIGPVSEVPGHPVVVAFAGLYNIGIAVDGNVWKVKGVTMLYRRFRVEQLSNDGNDSAALHSLQLLPTYTQGITHIREKQRSPLIPRHPSDPTLCGMCCLISSPKEGYMYDVFSASKLLSYYKYTCDTLSVSACNGLLHAITRQGLETYTVRVYAAASDWIREHAAEDIQHVQPEAGEHNFKQNSAENNGNIVHACVKEGDSTEEMNIAENISLGTDSGAASCQLSTTGTSSDDQSVSVAEPKDAEMMSDSQSHDTVSEAAAEQNVSPVATVTDKVCCESSSTGVEPDGTGTCHDSASSPSDVKLSVDNSGRTLARFTTGSKSLSCTQLQKGAHSHLVEQNDCDSESDAEFTSSQQARTFTVLNPLGRPGTIGSRVSESFYQAAVKRLSSDHGWMLPVCDLEDLRKRCPQSSLDICLIGMYPFVGVQFVSATEGGVILFTRASNHDALHRNRSFRSWVNVHRPLSEQGEGQSEWKIYVLHNMEPTQLYKAVMPLANRCQKHNAQAYHHLVCEQHLFLRTLCLVDSACKEDKKRKKLKKLLCESAANLAELFARTPTVFKDCAEYYIMSGLPLRDIVDRAWKSGHPAAKGLLFFLDQKLFGSDEIVAVSETTAKRIFKLYSKGKPSRVAEIILMSSLNGFSPDTALAALEDLKKTDTTEESPYSLAPLDNLARAVLYLHQCEPDHAQDALFSIPKKKLVEVLTAHYYLLHEDGTHFTPLAQLLRKHQPKPFMEALLNLHDTKVLPLDTLLGLLGTSKSDAFYNDLAVGFMEAVLNDKRREESFSVTAIQLSRIYLERIGASKRRLSPSSHNHIPNGEGHFGIRHLWLNKLLPFQGSLPAPVPGCPRSGPVSPQGSPQLARSTSLFSSPSRRSAGKAPYMLALSDGDSNECPCCCCNQDLMKLQALLCSKFVSSDLCASVLDKLEGQSFRGVLSLRLLCFPYVDRHTEAITTILEECSVLMLPYGIQYFNQDVTKWSHLLKILLDFTREESNSEDSDFKRRVIMEVLKGTLHQLSKLVSPTEFLALLPDDGALGFFLPYLQWCHRRCASESVSRGLMNGARQTSNLPGLHS